MSSITKSYNAAPQAFERNCGRPVEIGDGNGETKAFPITDLT
jgi:hypothetical protein